MMQGAKCFFAPVSIPHAKSLEVRFFFLGAFLAGGLDFGSGGHAAPRDFAPLPLHRSCLLESRCRGWSCERADKQVAEEVEMRFSQPRGVIEAQTSPAPRWYLDGTLVVAQPTGDFGLIVDEGWGLEVGRRYEAGFDRTAQLSGHAGLHHSGMASYLSYICR